MFIFKKPPSPKEQLRQAQRVIDLHRIRMTQDIERYERQIEGEEREAYALIERGQLARGKQHNYKACLLKKHCERGNQMLRSFDAAALNIPIIRDNMMWDESMRAMNAGLKAMLGCSNVPSAQHTLETHQDLLRDLELLNRERDNMVMESLGDVDRQAREDAERMTQDMMARVGARSEALSDGGRPTVRDREPTVLGNRG